MVVFNPNIKRKNETAYTHTRYVQINNTHMYTHILIKYRARTIFMMKSFLFNIQKIFFMEESFILYIKKGFTTNVVFLLPANQLWNLLTNKTTDRHVRVTPDVVGGCHPLISRHSANRVIPQLWWQYQSDPHGSS